MMSFDTSKNLIVGAVVGICALLLYAAAGRLEALSTERGAAVTLLKNCPGTVQIAQTSTPTEGSELLILCRVPPQPKQGTAL